MKDSDVFPYVSPLYQSLVKLSGIMGNAVAKSLGREIDERVIVTGAFFLFFTGIWMVLSSGFLVTVVIVASVGILTHDWKMAGVALGACLTLQLRMYWKRPEMARYPEKSKLSCVMYSVIATVVIGAVTHFGLVSTPVAFGLMAVCVVFTIAFSQIENIEKHSTKDLLMVGTVLILVIGATVAVQSGVKDVAYQVKWLKALLMGDPGARGSRTAFIDRLIRDDMIEHKTAMMKRAIDRRHIIIPNKPITENDWEERTYQQMKGVEDGLNYVDTGRVKSPEDDVAEKKENVEEQENSSSIEDKMRKAVEGYGILRYLAMIDLGTLGSFSRKKLGFVEGVLSSMHWGSSLVYVFFLVYIEHFAPEVIWRAFNECGRQLNAKNYMTPTPPNMIDDIFNTLSAPMTTNKWIYICTGEMLWAIGVNYNGSSIGWLFFGIVVAAVFHMAWEKFVNARLEDQGKNAYNALNTWDPDLGFFKKIPFASENILRGLHLAMGIGLLLSRGMFYQTVHGHTMFTWHGESWTDGIIWFAQDIIITMSVAYSLIFATNWGPKLTAGRNASMVAAVVVAMDSRVMLVTFFFLFFKGDIMKWPILGYSSTMRNKMNLSGSPPS